MKVGDYVRTKYGIAKITKIDVMEEISYTDNKDIVFGIEEQRCYEITQYAKLDSYVDSYYIPQDKLYILNYSPNIIDLIEVGDYVNGKLVEDIFDKTNYADKSIKLKGSGDYWYNEHIKSIVTREQFESIEYKVKE